MIALRRAGDRGRTRLDWLDSRHTFSFGGYHDPRRMGFRTLRVINDDRVIPGGGFATHSHRDMEIVSVVIEGALEHEDSLGTGSVIRPGDVQRMTAGTGVTHSEFNPSRTEPVRFLQIWILPSRPGLTPGYEQRSFADAEAAGNPRLVASPDGREGSLTLHQDALILRGRLQAGDATTYRTGPGRGVWLQVTGGALALGGATLADGDGAAVEDEDVLRLRAADGSGSARFLLFDLL